MKTRAEQRRQKSVLTAADGVPVASNPSEQIRGKIAYLPMEHADDGCVANVQASENLQPDTWSEAWRLECEARFALSLPDKSDHRKKGWKAVSKRQYLAGVRDKRGQHGHDVLRAEMVRIWKQKTK